MTRRHCIRTVAGLRTCLGSVTLRRRVLYDWRELLITLLYFELYINDVSNLLHKISLVLTPSSQTLLEDTIVRYVNTKVFQNEWVN